MALKRALIPPQANVQKLNQKIDWANAGIDVALVPTKWPHTNRTRRAAVCSYGYGGTVSHAVLEQAPTDNSLSFDQGADDNKPHLLILSAPQEKRLADVASSLKEWLSSAGKKWSLGAIEAALSTRRAEHDFRAAIIANSPEQATAELEKLANATSSANCISSRTLGKTDRKDVVWLFSGHGAQWPQMGQQMLAGDDVFRRTVENLETLVSEEAGFSPLDALTRGDFNSSDKVQVLTYIMQVALSASLTAKGVRPGAIIGHSVGEIAAAVAAGALSAIEGAIVVCRRAQLYKQVMGKGAMILVNQPFDEVAAELKGGDAVAAIDSSPTSCVVSGTVEAIERLEASFRTRQVKTFRVKSDIAFHSPLLEPLGEPLRNALEGLLHSRTPHSKYSNTGIKHECR
jgi:6-methylsalicylic acid synthase